MEQENQQIGCGQLLGKLLQWKKELENLNKAKDNYLGLFNSESKAAYEKQKQEVEKQRQEYRELLGKAFVEVETDYSGKKEKVFLPDYMVIKEIFEKLGGIGPEKHMFGSCDNHYIAIDKDGKVYCVNLNGGLGKTEPAKTLAALEKIKLLDKLKIFIFANSNLPLLPELPQNIEEINCWNNHMGRLEVLPDLRHLTKLKKLVCGNNDLKAVPQLPPQLEEIVLVHCTKLVDPGYNPQLTEQTLRQIKQQCPNCNIIYKH